MTNVIQKQVNKVFTDIELRKILISYALTLDEPDDLLTTLLTFGSTTIRAELYVNVAAGYLLSVRRSHVGGKEHDGPFYGYALSLGVRAEKLSSAIEHIRDLVEETVSFWALKVKA